MLLKPNKKPDYDAIPFKLYAIEVLPAVDAGGFYLTNYSKPVIKEITGKATYYHTMPVSETDSRVIFMVVGDDGVPVFELPIERLGSVEMVGEEILQKAELKVLPHEPTKRPKAASSGE